jgi:hypothetical protein
VKGHPRELDAHPAMLASRSSALPSSHRSPSQLSWHWPPAAPPAHDVRRTFPRSNGRARRPRSERGPRRCGISRCRSLELERQRAKRWRGFETPPSQEPTSPCSVSPIAALRRQASRRPNCAGRRSLCIS